MLGICASGMSGDEKAVWLHGITYSENVNKDKKVVRKM